MIGGVCQEQKQVHQEGQQEETRKEPDGETRSEEGEEGEQGVSDLRRQRREALEDRLVQRYQRSSPDRLLIHAASVG
jgi:hypothetical protein